MLDRYSRDAQRASGDRVLGRTAICTRSGRTPHEVLLEQIGEPHVALIKARRKDEAFDRYDSGPAVPSGLFRFVQTLICKPDDSLPINQAGLLEEDR